MKKRSIFVSALLLLAASGCERSPRDRLQGHWKGVAIESSHPGKDRAEGWVKGTTLEFSGTKVTVSLPTESPRSGTFKIAKIEGNQMSVLFKRPEGGEDMAKFRFSDDGKLVWEMGQGEMVLVRTEL